LTTSHQHNGDLVLGNEVQTAVVPLVEVVLRGVEDGGCGIFGEGLELVLFRLGFDGVERAFGDLVDVVGVEVAQLPEESSLLSGGESVVESLQTAN
jgi:hypothetical protein